MTTPHTAYIICATPRSGSSLLCESLSNTFVAGQPEEYFHKKSEYTWRTKWQLSSSEAYFRWLIDHGTSPNGVFGVKIMWEQMDYCIQFLRGLPQFHSAMISPPGLLSSVFPNLSYIWITRRDKVRQAVSDDITIQTGRYVSTDPKPTASSSVKFNFNRIDFLYYRLSAAEDAWGQYFVQAGVKPFHVVYEDFIESYDDTVNAILDYLRIPVPANHTFAPPRLQKMADATNEDWVQRYNEMRTSKAENTSSIHRRLATWLAGALPEKASQ